MNKRVMQQLKYAVSLTEKKQTWSSLWDRNWVALTVLLVVAMMIVPLPTWMLDLLITTNLLVATVIVLSSLSGEGTRSFSSLPNLLLITTLFRLSLNISSTRLILLQADAGRVIQAFGSFVVQGSYLVGAVIFAILTLVQFIVIAKGSERIAEVGARFSLDAMPGKQLTIDSEAKLGVLSAFQAKTQRAALHADNQFFGAMDGAIKFVKGDAIASIIIIFVNFFGGFVVGTLEHNMSPAKAVQTFGLLTIGDGLVSQIPALLISAAAGFVVTRSSQLSKQSSVNSLIVEQFAKPSSQLVAGFLLFCLALVPGLPLLPFAVLGLGTATFGIYRMLKQTNISNTEASAQLKRQVTATIPGSWTSDSTNWNLDQLLVSLRQSVNTKKYFGFEVDLALRVDPDTSHITFSADGSASQTTIPVGARAVFRAKSRPLTDFFESSEIIFVNGIPSVWVTRQHESGLDGLELLSSEKLVLETMSLALVRFCHQLIDVDLVEQLLEQECSIRPALVNAAVPQRIDSIQLLVVMKQLAKEALPILPLGPILESIVLGSETNSPEERYVQVRRHLELARRIRLSSKLPKVVLQLETELENLLRDSIVNVSAQRHLGLQPQEAKELMEAIAEPMKQWTGKTGYCVIAVRRQELRLPLFNMINSMFPFLSVLSIDELDPNESYNKTIIEIPS